MNVGVWGEDTPPLGLFRSWISLGKPETWLQILPDRGENWTWVSYTLVYLK